MTICLSELDGLLFPECYPFSKDHLRDDLKILKDPRINDREVLNAIVFKIRVAGLSMRITQMPKALANWSVGCGALLPLYF
jgi:hypothetical protein